VQRLCRGAEVTESLEDLKDKLRRSSDFSTRSHSCKECRSERTLWESSESLKLRRSSVFENAGETQGEELAEEDEQRSRPLRI
jgi:hypothetical protein